MWSYRDWVINALNANMPFDQFTIEQIAGDLLPNKTLDQQVASGFNRCNMTTNEGGAIDEEYKVLYTRDRTETLSQVFLGLTTGCAVCHDHKFDPISQKEFYELSAFFNNTTQAAMDGNIPDTPPTVFVAPLPYRPRWDALQIENAGFKQGIESRKIAARSEFNAFFAAAKPETLDAMIPRQGLKLRALIGDGDSPAPGANQPGGVLELADAGDFDKDQAFSYGAFVRVPKGDAVGAVLARENGPGWDLWIQNGVVGAHFVNKWPDDAFKQLVLTNERGAWCCRRRSDSPVRHLRRLGQARGVQDLRRRHRSRDDGRDRDVEEFDPHQGPVHRRAEGLGEQARRRRHPRRADLRSLAVGR